MFLIDPTFKQFCDPEREREGFGELNPGYKIGKTLKENGFLENLLTKGYAKLTPSLAKSYLTSFLSEDAPIEPSEATAWKFLKTPPFHGNLYYLSRSELSGYEIPLPLEKPEALAAEL